MWQHFYIITISEWNAAGSLQRNLDRDHILCSALAYFSVTSGWGRGGSLSTQMTIMLTITARYFNMIVISRRTFKQNLFQFLSFQDGLHTFPSWSFCLRLLQKYKAVVCVSSSAARESRQQSLAESENIILKQKPNNSAHLISYSSQYSVKFITENKSCLHIFEVATSRHLGVLFKDENRACQCFRVGEFFSHVQKKTQ